MPIFECQECDYLTDLSELAKIHNRKNRNHVFKRSGVHTYLDIKISKIFDEIRG